MVIDERLASIKLRKNFYRDNYRRALAVLWVLLSVIVLLVAVVTYLFLEQSQPDFYATSGDGKLAKIKAMNTPNYSSTPLIQ